MPTPLDKSLFFAIIRAKGGGTMKRFIVPRVAHCDDGGRTNPGLTTVSQTDVSPGFHFL